MENSSQPTILKFNSTARQWQCQRKIRHDSREAAEATRTRLAYKALTRIYRCDFCEGFHIAGRHWEVTDGARYKCSVHKMTFKNKPNWKRHFNREH